MNIDLYSDRAKQAIQSAQSLALARGHQQFAPEHILKVLLEEKDGLGRALIQSAGGRPDQLAAVIGHEAGHVVAHHAAERVSQERTSKILLGIAGAAAGSSDFGKLLKDHGDDAAKFGVLLPFSRKQELEADRLGVDYMARAGYRPREAVVLWRNMQALDGGKSGGDMSSTHPSDAVRIQELERYLVSKGW